MNTWLPPAYPALRAAVSQFAAGGSSRHDPHRLVRLLRRYPRCTASTTCATPSGAASALLPSHWGES